MSRITRVRIAQILCVMAVLAFTTTAFARSTSDEVVMATQYVGNMVWSSTVWGENVQGHQASTDANGANCIADSRGSDGLVYVGSWSGGGTIYRTDLNGVVQSSFNSGVSGILGVAFDSSGNLLVSSYYGTIQRFNPLTGAAIDSSPFIVGEHEGELGEIYNAKYNQLTIADGKIFVGDRYDNLVHVYDETTGADLGTIGDGVLTSDGPGGQGPEKVLFGRDLDYDEVEDIYVADRNGNRVCVFSGADYSLIDDEFLRVSDGSRLTGMAWRKYQYANNLSDEYNLLVTCSNQDHMNYTSAVFEYRLDQAAPRFEYYGDFAAYEDGGEDMGGVGALFICVPEPSSIMMLVGAALAALAMIRRRK